MLRILRLGALHFLVCAALLAILLAWRSGLEAGWGLRPAAVERAGAPTMGVTVDLLGQPPQMQRVALERLAAAGITWVRVRAAWEAIEPAPGAYDWGPLDELLATVEASTLEAVVVLDGSPAWARRAEDGRGAGTPASLAPPADPSTFATFAGAAAHRYRGRVLAWQVWDEPNIAPHWGNRMIDPVGYAQLLRVTSVALRAADPAAVILTAALAPTADRGHLAIDEVHFVQRMIAAGAVGSFDALALQPFGFGDAPSTTAQGVHRLNFQRLAVVRRTMVDAGLSETPIWAVRLGWNRASPSPWGSVTETDQLAYAHEARVITLEWPWLSTIGWVIDQPTAAPDDPLWGFALIDPLLAAWTAPLQPSTPATSTASQLAVRDASRTLALSVGAIVILVSLAVRDLRRVPWRAFRLRFAALPQWTQATFWTVALGGYYLATWPPVTGFWLVTLALLAMLQPRAALVVTAALLPFQRYHKEIPLPLGLTPAGHLTLAPLAAAALVLLPALVLDLWKRLDSRNLRTVPRRLLWCDWLALAWLVLSLISMGGMWQRSAYAAGLVNGVLAPLLIYVAVRLFVRSERDVLTLAAALVAGGLASAAMGLLKWAGGSGVAIDGVLRLVGPHDSPNHTALILERALMLGAGLGLALRGRPRRLAALILLPIVIALVLTASRGALLLGVPLGLTALIWFWLMRGEGSIAQRIAGLLRRRSVRGLLLLSALIASVALFAGEARLLNQSTVDNRILLWPAAVKLWRSVPLTGVGPGGFLWSYPAFLPFGAAVESNLLHPHNVWLELATGWGVGGLLWVVGTSVLWLVSSGRNMPSLPRSLQGVVAGLSAGLIAALAHAQVDAFLALPDLAGWFFIALGMVATVGQLAISHPGGSGADQR